MANQKYTTDHIPDKLRDFRVFLCMVWAFLGLPPPTPVQLDIAYYLQHGPRRKIIMAFRGVGKSWITSAYVVWRLLWNPQLNFLVVSASKNRADDFSTFTSRLIKEIPILRPLVPRSDQRDSKIAFDVGPAEADHAPSVKSVGIFGQLTGGRADEIIADDVEVPANAFTQAMREKLSEAVKEFDAVLKPGGTVTYLGTPQTEQSLYNVLPDRGYNTQIWPARYPDKEAQVIYGDKLADFIVRQIDNGKGYVGGPVDPKRFNEDELMEREASYGRSGFALQFMLDTRLSDADRYPLRLSDLVVMNLNHEQAPERVVWTGDMKYALNDLECVGFNGDRYFRPYIPDDVDYVDYNGSVLAIDPSGRGSDETAYAVVKFLNGFLYVTAAGGVKGGYEDEALKSLAQIAKQQKVNKIIVESNFGDGMFEKLLIPWLRKIYPVLIENEDVIGIRHNTQKERRIIDTLEPIMNQHRLVIDRRVIEDDLASTKDMAPDVAVQYQLMYQITRITIDRGALKHDDRIDVLAMAVKYWTDQVAMDAQKAMASRREMLLQRELDVMKHGNELGLDCLIMGGDPTKVTGGTAGSWKCKHF